MTDWLPPLVAVTVISLSGFLAILLFPCILTSSSSPPSASPKSLAQSPLLKFLVALCIGTLLGDAVIHLIPDIFTSQYVLGPPILIGTPSNVTILANTRSQISQCISQCSTGGVNTEMFPFDECQARCWQVIDENDVRQGQPARDAKPAELLEMALAILFGLYFFYTVERLIQHRHGHHHHDDDDDDDDDQEGDDVRRDSEDSAGSNSTLRSGNATDLESATVCERESLLLSVDQNAASFIPPRSPLQRWKSTIVNSQRKQKKRPTITASAVVVNAEDKQPADNWRDSFSEIRSFGWVVLMGEALHNIVDGLAIGAAFASSFQIGLGTALSILFHEIPHELGDFAIYINAGFTPLRALLVNCFVNLTSFLGVIVSLLLVGSSHSTSDPNDPDNGRIRLWVLAFTAGNFIYIALVDLIPELTREDGKKPVATGAQKQQGRWKALRLTLLEHLGILFGVGCMVLIKLYGEAEGGE